MDGNISWFLYIHLYIYIYIYIFIDICTVVASSFLYPLDGPSVAGFRWVIFHVYQTSGESVPEIKILSSRLLVVVGADRRRLTAIQKLANRHRTVYQSLSNRHIARRVATVDVESILRHPDSIRLLLLLSGSGAERLQRLGRLHVTAGGRDLREEASV